MEPVNPSGPPTGGQQLGAAPGGAAAPAGTVAAGPSGYPGTAVQTAVAQHHQHHQSRGGLISLPTAAAPFDPGALLMHPQAAAAVAAVAAAAAQQMVQAQAGAPSIRIQAAPSAPAPPSAPTQALLTRPSSSAPAAGAPTAAQIHSALQAHAMALPAPAVAQAPHHQPVFAASPMAHHLASLVGVPAAAGGHVQPANPQPAQTYATIPSAPSPATSSLPQVQSGNPAAMAAAAAQVVAAHAAAANATHNGIASGLLANMQNWNLEQLGTSTTPAVGMKLMDEHRIAVITPPFPSF